MLSSQKILRKLKARGWYEVSQKGSHVHLKHPSHSGRVTVPHPKKDVPIGTIKSISRQSGINFP